MQISKLKMAGMFAVAACSLMCGQANAGLQKGDEDFSAFLNYTKYNGQSANAFGDLSVGYQITDHIEIPISLFIDKSSGSTVFGYGVGANYYFSAGPDIKWAPYVGVDLDLTDINTKTNGNSNSDSQAGFDGHAGIKYFWTERATVNAELEYQSLSDKNSNKTMDGVLALIGISIYY